MITLRPYQQENVDLTRQAVASGKKRPLIALPTGGGKSIIIGQIIKLALEKGSTCLFLVHRRNLVTQFRDTLSQHFDIDAGVIMAGHEFEAGKKVYLATIQTYSRRINLERLEINRFFIDADVVLIDEAHLSISPTYKKVLNLYSKRILVGCTATPCRGDGRGLGEVFDALVSVIDTGKLTEMGFLSPVRYFAPSTPDLEKLKIRLGDYEKKGLADKMDKPKLIGDVVENWLKLAGGRKTMVFAVNVKHSRHICDEFKKAGIRAMHIDAKTPDEEREAAFDALEHGEITVITNVAVYQEGIDVPDISCVCMARPTKSLALYRQCCGRGLRVSPGKKDMILLDFGGVVEEHGFLTDEIEWTLDGEEKAFHKKKKKESEPKSVKCSSCGLIYQGESRCPDCGSKPESFGKPVKSVDAELTEMNPKKRNRVYSWADKRRMMSALTWYARQKGYKYGWAVYSYRDLFGVLPWDRRVKNATPIKPEGKTELLLKHLLIKKAKAYQASKR